MGPAGVGFAGWLALAENPNEIRLFCKTRLQKRASVVCRLTTHIAAPCERFKGPPSDTWLLSLYNERMNRVRTTFRTTSSITAYRDQEEGYAQDPYPLPEGAIIWAADKNDETRTLNGKNIRVILFTIGGSGIWYWIPREQFVRLTERCQLSSH